MGIKKISAALLTILMLFAGCQANPNENIFDEEEPPESQQEWEQEESAVSTSSIPEPLPEPEAESEPEPEPEPLQKEVSDLISPSFQPTELLDWQEDPALLHEYWIIWDHLEYRLFGPPEEYVEHTFEVPRCSKDGIFLEIYQNDSINVSFMLPPNVVGDYSVRDFDGGFANGPLKMGEVLPIFYVMGSDEDPFHMDSGVFSREELLRDGDETFYEEIITRENVVGGVHQTDNFIRGILPMQRQIVEQLGEGEKIIELPANHLVRYYVVLDGTFLTYAYFYVSAQATAEDLELYDAIINSMEIVK